MTQEQDAKGRRPTKDEPLAQPPQSDGSGVRRRVVRHLRRILITTAATGAAAGLVAGCGSDVETTPDTGGAGGSAGSTVTGGTGGTGGTIGGGGEGGDVVCDPLPDPLVCDGDPDTAYFAEFAYWSAEWRQSGSDMVVHVTIQSYAYQPDSLEFSADPTAAGGTVQAVDRQATQLELDVLPDASATEVVLTVPLDCNGVDEQLVLAIDVASPGSAGDPVTITPGE